MNWFWKPNAKCLANVLDKITYVRSCRVDSKTLSKQRIHTKRIQKLKQDNVDCIDIAAGVSEPCPNRQPDNMIAHAEQGDMKQTVLDLECSKEFA
jgi:hypothetical protein